MSQYQNPMQKLLLAVRMLLVDMADVLLCTVSTRDQKHQWFVATGDRALLDEQPFLAIKVEG